MDGLDYVQSTISASVLLIYYSFLGILLCRVPWRYYDRMGKIVLCLQNVFVATKVINLNMLAWGVAESDNSVGMRIINTIVSQSLWLTVCYFSIEVRAVKIFLESKNLKEFTLSLKRYKRFKIVAMSVQIIISTIGCSLNIAKYFLRAGEIDLYT